MRHPDEKVEIYGFADNTCHEPTGEEGYLLGWSIHKGNTVGIVEMSDRRIQLIPAESLGYKEKRVELKYIPPLGPFWNLTEGERG